jgi:hypothetical protein
MRKQWVVRVLLLAAVLGLGIWAWQYFFPGPEKAVRKRLDELARIASIAPNEAPAARMLNAQKLTTFFSSDVKITVELSSHGQQVFNGIDELRGAAMAARSTLTALKVEFPDINVTIGPDKRTAFVELTARGVVPGDKEIYVQELKATFKKIEGDWLIVRVETVKTLN